MMLALTQTPDEFRTFKGPGKGSGTVETPRDYHGRWCKGAGCEQGAGTILETDDPAVFAKLSPEARISAPDDWFASDADWAAARDLADLKARNVPKPTAKQIAANKRAAKRAAAGKGRAGGDLRGSSFARRERGEALFDEFGGTARGYVPCTHCGIKVSPSGRGGHAAMEQDKILTLHEGGKYGTAKSGFPNLIPSCSGCNKHRGETKYPTRPLWESAKPTRKRALVAAAARSLIGEVVVGFPLNWNDPEADGIGRPVQGVLMVRTVDAWFGEYEQWIVGGEVVDPDSVREPEALVASVVPDGATVRALAVGWDGRLTDETDWALDRSDLPLLTVQIGTLVITHVADLDYDQYTVNGIPVDPHTIASVELGLVASVCDRCGLPRDLDALVAAGSEHVPRDWHGKWCKGAQCSAPPSKPLISMDEATIQYEHGVMTHTEYGEVIDNWKAYNAAQSQQIIEQIDIAPILGLPATPGMKQAPLSYDDMSPGQKAAWTKKQHKMAADSAAKHKAEHQANIDNQAYKDMDAGQPLNGTQIEMVSDTAIDKYIDTYYPGTKGPAAGDPAERRAFVSVKNTQHMADQSLLVNDAGYASGTPKGPRESRRAVLRETGQRRPTGGPKSDQTHEFYTDDQIQTMQRDKLEAVVYHHNGGALSQDDVKGMSSETLRASAYILNSSYREHVEHLQAKGYANDQIPRSARSTQRMKDGISPGFQHNGKYGPSVEPHGPKSQAAIAASIKASVGNAVPAGPLNHSHPAGWDSWGAGKKAAWTKSHGGKPKIQLTVPHPAEWESWGPGKKAAWTKKHKVGAVVTTHSPLGQHVTTVGSYHDMTHHIHSKPPMSTPGGYHNQHSQFAKAVDSADPDALGAVSNYTGFGYHDMNQQMRYGTHPYEQPRIDNMKRAFNYAPFDQPKIVERGKSQSKSGFKEFQWEVGGVYPDKGFWSASTSRDISEGFGNRVYMRVNTNGVKGIPGNLGEKEWIYPQNTKFRVTAIRDVMVDGTMYRYIEADMVP